MEKWVNQSAECRRELIALRSIPGVGASVEELLSHYLSVLYGKQTNLVHLHSLPGGLVRHVVLEPDDESVAVWPRAGYRRRVDLVIGGPPFTDVLRAHAHMAIVAIDNDRSVHRELTPKLSGRAGRNA